MAGHSKGVVKGEFCAKRAPKCRDGQKYQKNCSPSPKAWQDTFFTQGRRKQAKYFEAHHLLCVASVTKFIARKTAIKDVVKNTKWCVNRQKNMYAMPLWGHVIQHYCRIEERGLSVSDRVDKEGVRAPKFKDIPCHDYDHNSSDGYRDEVEVQLQTVANEVQEMKEAHEAKVKGLQDRLNGLSTRYRRALKSRGKRKEGTHKAWGKGKRDEDDEWYQPFSMANDDNVNERAFPSADGGDLAQKIAALVKAFKR